MQKTGGLTPVVLQLRGQSSRFDLTPGIGHGYRLHLTVDQLKQPHTSVQRNPAIADVFFRRGLIEKWGRGTQRIVEMCLAGGYPEPEFLEESGVVTVRFPRSSYAPPAQVKHDLTDRQQEILRALAAGKRRSFGEIYEQLAGNPARRTIQAEPRMLRDLRLVDSRGRGRAAVWWLRFDNE